MKFDDAFANAAHIPHSETYPEKWAQRAAAFRAAVNSECDLSYGDTDRQKLDLFHPPGTAKGTVMFVHGGYWLRFCKSDWSHFAAGPLAHGWRVAMPSYDLCPSVRISQIGAQIAAAIVWVSGQYNDRLRLCGHSAGGQLVARCAAHAGAEKIVPISPVTDLAPLMQTSMNADLRIDAAEARAESPVHLPKPKTHVHIWVGADERPVFRQQADTLAKTWDCPVHHANGQHHFNVVEALADPGSDLTRTVVL